MDSAPDDFQSLLSVAANINSDIDQIKQALVIARSRALRATASRKKKEAQLHNILLANARMTAELSTSLGAHAPFFADANGEGEATASAIPGWKAAEALALVSKLQALDTTPEVERLTIIDCELLEEIVNIEGHLLPEEDLDISCSEPFTVAKLQQRLSRLLKQQQELEAAL